MLLEQLKLFLSNDSLLKKGNYFQWTDFVSVKSRNESDYEEKAGQIHNDLQTFHAIVIFVVFKKNYGKRSY